ncbi:F-box/kelch-repeat protein At3g23880, partial [Medicago truncatula]
NNTIYSQIFAKRRQLTGTLTSPSLPALPLPTLPFELIEEILARLPVKLLLQLRCACKSWNFLISNTKFHKKHLSLSTTHTLHCVSYSFKYVLKSYPLDSLFTNVTTTDIGQLKHSLCNVSLVGSCNGILCLAVYYVGSALIQFRLWNPSIRKLKELPPDKNSRDRLPLRVCSRFSDMGIMMYGFGYDVVNDNYKVVSVLRACECISGNFVKKDEVKVHTLGANSWKRIPMFPFAVVPIQKSGQCVSGTINWLVSKDTEKSQCFILSLDMRKDSYQKVFLPNDGKVDGCSLHLSVFRDCLTVFCGDDVWVMKEYGNNESWTKLFTISDRPAFMKAIYVFKDEQVLLKPTEDWAGDYIFNNCRDCTSKSIDFENTPEVCVESLISPYS